MTKIEATASFPKGDAGLGLVSESQINQMLAGRIIASVKFDGHSGIAISLVGGGIVELESSGIEGDDLSIEIK